MTHRFQNQCFLNRKGHSSKGTPLVSTKKKATKVVMLAQQQAKKRNVAHCSQTGHQIQTLAWHSAAEHSTAWQDGILSWQCSSKQRRGVLPFAFRQVILRSGMA